MGLGLAWLLELVIRDKVCLLEVVLVSRKRYTEEGQEEARDAVMHRGPVIWADSVLIQFACLLISSCLVLSILSCLLGRGGI